jgi:rhodanese-related sulfurtransferase
LDVRNPQEVEICILPNALTIPLPYLQERIDELEELEGAPIVAYCHHGVRSISAAAILMNKGFSDVRSLRGGIDAWAREVAPNMTRY